MRYVTMVIMVIVAILTVGCLAGCIQPDMDPLERTFNTTMVEVVKPAIMGVTEDLSHDSAQLQGSLSVIAPAYYVRGYAGLFNGIMWDFEIGLDGAAANLSGATQATPGDADDEGGGE